MNTLSKLIAFYFINLIVFFLIGILFGSDVMWMINSIKSWLFPLFVVLVGLFFGYLTIVVQKPTKRNVVYNYSLSIVSIGIGLMLFGTHYSDWKHEQDFGNTEANSDYFKYFNGQHEYEQKLAFDSLSTKFNTPNDFKILGNFTYTKDSLLNGDTLTLYSMTFFYQKKNDENYYKADFNIFNNIANLVYYDSVLNLDDYSKIVRFTRGVKKTFTDAWRKLPDSVKQRIQNEFPDLSD